MDRAKTRKPHKKSRNGCLPCKGRHVKCDEQQPHCANCIKQGTTCEYRPVKSPAGREVSNGSPLRFSTPVITPSSTDGTTRDQTPALTSAPAAGDTVLNIPQLRLFYHYTSVTAKTLATNRKSEEIFSTTFVEQAFTHPYLLHAVLAVSALHLHYLESEGSSQKLEYWRLAERHHDAGLNLFQAMVRDIDTSNFKAVLLFAGAIFPYSCVASVNTSSDLGHAFENIFSIVVLTRRTRPMVSNFYWEMRGSELACMIPDDVNSVEWDTAESPNETELVQLRKFAEVVHHVYPPDIVDAYGYAIHILELMFDVVSKSSTPPSDALLKIWIHFIPDRYVELLSERQPGSLIIFAHFAVMLHRSEHYWFIIGVAEQILKIADAMVPMEWKSWLDWPKQQIRGFSTPPGQIPGVTT